MGNVVKASLRPFHDRRLLDAASKGQSKAVRRHIEAGARVNRVFKSGRRPLVEAVRSGDHETVKQLLLGNADVNGGDVLGTTALIAACERTDMEMIEILLEVKPDFTIVSRSVPFPPPSSSPFLSYLLPFFFLLLLSFRFIPLLISPSSFLLSSVFHPPGQ